MAPAGEMWSVVIESPSMARTRAPRMSSGSSTSISKPRKYGASRMYVESGSQSNRAPVGAGTAFHASDPSDTVLYRDRNISGFSDSEMVCWISDCDGQMSRR